MDTYVRLNALADTTHTCGPDWTTACWACEAGSVLNSFDGEAAHLLSRFDAAQVEIDKAPSTP